MQEIHNFSKFYSLFNRLPCAGDREYLKKELVLEYTRGRTESLKEIKRGEYEALCEALEQLLVQNPAVNLYRQALKRKRSEVLHQMQLYGIDTSDWTIVNRFCENKRIAGKSFRHLEYEELEALYKKLRAMRKKQEDNL